MDILISPIITEKSMSQATGSRYSFKVAKSATKNTIKKIIEEKFKVNVLSITTVNMKKIKTRMGAKRVQKLNKFYKKAVITLKAGQKIGLFDAGSSTK